MLRLDHFLLRLLRAACFLVPLAAAADPPKTALLVAVGDYPPESGWQKINSANDVAIMREALLAQGFAEADIFVLQDGQATREGILDAIRQHLEGRAQRGGVAYFHFSGHGQQVADDNGDELDGYDEALVPADSPVNFEEGVYEGENLLRDDELGRALDNVRRKLGPEGNLQVVLDACHSGTGTRGFGTARGTQVKMASESRVAANLSRGSDAAAMEFPSSSGEGGLAPVAAFFGAAQNQLNFETTDEQGRGVGSLSCALSKKLAAAAPGTTYRGLFEQVRLEMSATAPRQQPQAEGTLDQEILGGRILGAPAFFRVAQWSDPGSVVIEAGWLRKVPAGSVVGFFPAETRSAAGLEPLAKGTVTTSGPTTSTVTLDTDLDQAAALGAWAFVLEQGFGSLRVSLAVQLPQSHPALPFLKSRLEKLPVSTQEEGAELHLVTSGGSGGETASRGAAVQLVTRDDLVLETFPGDLRPEMLADRIVRQVLAYGQARFLKNLEMPGSELPLDFEIVPLRYDRRSKTVLEALLLDSKRDASGTIHLQDGDVFKIKVTNNGWKPAYFTLIDIQPDNHVEVLLPGPNDAPAEFVVPAGQSLEVNRLFEIKPPAGVEVFKLVATGKAVDLRPISSSRGQGPKSNASQFERFFAQTYFNEECQSRGGRTISLGAEEVGVTSLTFVID